MTNMEYAQINKLFPSGSSWYYINQKGDIKSFIVHSGISPKDAQIFSTIFVLYKTFEEANIVLTEFNKNFNTF